MDKVKVLTQNTLIPLSAIMVVVGATGWLTTVWRQGEANAAQIQEVKVTQKADNDRLFDELHRISDKLDRLIEQ